MDATASQDPVLPGLLDTATEALFAAEGLLGAAKRALKAKVAPTGRIDADAMEIEQFAAHGFAWLATYVEGLRQMLDWARRLDGAGKLGPLERLMLQAAFGEYLSQIAGGIAISQVEIVRLSDIGVGADSIARFASPAVKTLAIDSENATAPRPFTLRRAPSRARARNGLELGGRIRPRATTQPGPWRGDWPLRRSRGWPRRSRRPPGSARRPRRGPTCAHRSRPRR